MRLMTRPLSFSRSYLLLLGPVLMAGCVDKAPPATWPEPPPPLLAEPVGGEEAKVPSSREPDEPSEAVDGTNDPQEGAVGLEEAASLDKQPEGEPAVEAAPEPRPE